MAEDKENQPQEDGQEAHALVGLPDGHVLETPEGQPNEKVVYERDEEGNVTGWHKEVVNG
jgi:hypothetical protein